LVVVEDGRIASVAAQSHAEMPNGAKRLDFGEHILAPGLVDIHVHGGAGYDVMQDDESGRTRFEEFLARHGVTSYYPTTVTAPLDTILRALERLANAVESAQTSPGTFAQPLGIHLEGPFLSHLRRGVHPPENLLTPDLSTFDKLWQASRGHIRLMTIAPELPGATELIAEASKRGVCVSVGHSDASLDQTRAAVTAGARHATHTFNAMRPLDHRDPGILGEVLSNPSLTADIIADGVHVHPSIVRLFLEAKGAESAVLITDATAATGMPDGRYQLGSLEVDVRDGKCLHGGKLAGSVLELDRALRNIMNFAGWSLHQALRLATLNPARVSGARNKGTIAPGADADLVVLTSAGDIQASVVKGVIVQP
jgi:N-acetylglucosamine-6-phosphate deacetylase